MTNTNRIQAEHRQPMSPTGLKQLRKEGRLPGVIFGAKQDSTMIHIGAKAFWHWKKNGADDVLELSIGAETISVRVESVQRDAVTREYIHADFLRV